MLQHKMLAVMAEVNTEVAEREKLIEYIAIALLTRNNLFILGDTGQAKSYAINHFRRRITGARQFERLLSKQCDEEQLFGRLDLGSLIPGGVPESVLEVDATYQKLRKALAAAKAYFEQNPEEYASLQKLGELADQVAAYRKTLAELHGSEPCIITKGKIPDCHICFLDEVFKANDGILNALLTALNERRYTNEGRTVDIPVLSFFAASNEIPNFSDPAESILRPLYDRFNLKVVTEYVQDREKRLEMLAKKQSSVNEAPNAFISLDELLLMQEEVAQVTVSPAINELMDDVLCDLRRKNIHVSDRKFFNFYPIVQAKAWLDGRNEVQAFDLLCLEAYLWTSPEEIPEIRQTLGKKCVNPLKDKADAIRTLGLEVLDAFQQDVETSGSKAIVKFRGEIVAVYRQAKSIEAEAESNGDQALCNALLYDLNEISRQAHTVVNFTVVPLDELVALN